MAIKNNTGMQTQSCKERAVTRSKNYISEHLYPVLTKDKMLYKQRQATNIAEPHGTDTIFLICSMHMNCQVMH